MAYNFEKVLRFLENLWTALQDEFKSPAVNFFRMEWIWDYQKLMQIFTLTQFSKQMNS